MGREDNKNQVKSLITTAKVQHDKLLIQNLTSNPKALYGYVRDKSKVKTSIDQLEKPDGSLTDNESEVVGVLNDFFQSVFTQEDPSSVPNFPFKVGCTLNEIYLTEAEVYNELSSLNPYKAPGPDSVHPNLLKNCASSLAHPLFLLYTQSLNSGTIPEEWKKANIMPIFKKGSKVKANNYRPISLTSSLVKILESIIRTKIMEYLTDNNIVTHYQHGFVTKKSCFTNLLETFEDWTAAVDQGYGVDVVYLDYSKAFDSVPHLRLIEKLKGYGIGGNLLNWMKSFLHGRFQRVVLNGIESQWLEVTSGVPQGSVLGPLLFVLYINDIAENIKCKLGIFADDTKIYSIINSVSNVEDLQCDLDNMQEWCETWLLNLNLDKCKVMHIGRTLNSTYKMNISNTCIDLCEVESEKDLGLWVTSSLKPSLHCVKAAAKATKILGMLKRTFPVMSKELFLFLYRIYVRPQLEYCVQLWSPYLARDIDAIEKVQRRATKLVSELVKLPYESRLRELGIYSLYCRRQRGDLIETYKLLNGYYNVDWTKFFSLTPVPSTRGHYAKLYKKTFKLQLRSNFFTQRCVNMWNSLPEFVVSATSIQSFKQQLDEHWSVIRHGYEQRLSA